MRRFTYLPLHRLARRRPLSIRTPTSRQRPPPLVHLRWTRQRHPSPESTGKRGDAAVLDIPSREFGRGERKRFRKAKMVWGSVRVRHGAITLPSAVPARRRRSILSEMRVQIKTRFTSRANIGYASRSRHFLANGRRKPGCDCRRDRGPAPRQKDTPNAAAHGSCRGCRCDSRSP